MAVLADSADLAESIAFDIKHNDIIEFVLEVDALVDDTLFTRRLIDALLGSLKEND